MFESFEPHKGVQSTRGRLFPPASGKYRPLVMTYGKHSLAIAIPSNFSELPPAIIWDEYLKPAFEVLASQNARR